MNCLCVLRSTLDVVQVQFYGNVLLLIFYFNFEGKTAAIAGVYGPVEVKPNKILIEKASVEAFYRPKTGLPSK